MSFVNNYLKYLLNKSILKRDMNKISTVGYFICIYFEYLSTIRTDLYNSKLQQIHVFYHRNTEGFGVLTSKVQFQFSNVCLYKHRRQKSRSFTKIERPFVYMHYMCVQFQIHVGVIHSREKKTLIRLKHQVRR